MAKPWQQQIFDVSIRKKEKWLWAQRQLQRYMRLSHRCLDVGSGVGTLSMLQERLGATWEFTETDHAAAQETARVVQGKVHVVDIYSEVLPRNTYDIITIFDVIEHVPDPVAFLGRAHDLLAPGGHIILTTPADEGAYYFWRRLAERMFGIDKAAHGHIVEGFTKKELGRLTQLAGLHVVTCDPFSFFFTEMVELAYNSAYIMRNRTQQRTHGYNLALSPASGPDVHRHATQLAWLRIFYPLIRAVSLLDHLGISRQGYEWGLVATKN